MGGGGGGSWSNVDPGKAEEYLKQSISATEKDAFEQNIAKLIDDHLVEINQRDDKTMQDRLKEIKDGLQKDIDGFLDFKFGGSVQKHTYVDGLSDIDSLVIVNKSELIDSSPEEVKKYFLSTLKDSLENVESVTAGQLAITVQYKDGMQIQLLPAIRTKTGIKIPSSSGTEWSDIINPEKFASKLSEVNAKIGFKVVPAIKIIKYINSQFSSKNQLTGYHIESLAIKAFSSCQGTETKKDLVAKFFSETKDLVKSPIADKSGQEIHVDSYLGKANSKARLGVSYQLDLTFRKIKNANNTCSLDAWKDILGEI